MKEKIKSLAKKYFAETVAVRRHIHANPELSFVEYKTATYVASKLREYGIPFTEGVAGTGIVAIIEGNNPSSKIVGLRSELDALPIKEQNTADYCSLNDGVMHACGHDVHTASLLGAARILNDLKAEWSGTIKLIIQPGEELLPGGASLMIDAGVLENPAPASMIAQHVFPSMETGKVGFRSGIYMASCDEIYVTVNGKGGHGALPHLTIDPVLIAANIIVSLQQVVSRRAKPGLPNVLSFGKVEAAGATNIIPEKVKMEGTFRTMDEQWRTEAHQIMKKMAEGIAESMGGTCEFNIMRGYPVLTNDEEVSGKAKANAIEYLGAEHVEDLDLRMTAEDFAFYAQKVPVCFYRLGTGNIEKGITSGVHTPTFDIDERALETGAGLMAWLAVKELGN